MAARSPHVESSVNERRLRPIYDCLDNGNNKKALQEAEKLLRKQKDFQCAKVLKALALLRLGKQEDAGIVLKEVHEEAPVDDPTLQAMTVCYRELHKPDLIADAYAAAVKKDSQNEELMTHLFMAYVRLNDYKKQQQIAMNLYKLKPKNPYYFWAVMSIVMQAFKADEKLSSTMLLPLAQRMTEKFISENKIDAEAEVELYLMILELQHKYEDALNVFDGPLGERLSSHLHYHEERRAELITKLQHWSEANIVYKNLILSNPDQWSYYLEYFRTSFKLFDENFQAAENCSAVPDHTPEMIAEFILARVQDEDMKTSHFLRGPLLARMELIRQLRERQMALDQLGNLLDLILKYYDKFGDRGCCIEDIRSYLGALDHEAKQTVLTELEYYLFGVLEKVFDPSESANEKDLQRHINYLQLCDYIGKHNSLLPEEKIDHAVKLLDYYNGSDKFAQDLLSTDYNPVDLGCIHASHLMIKAWLETDDFNLIWKPITVLETALKRSPYNHQIKLLLIKLYNKLGAVGASFVLYESLDVKHVQQDSLGYLVTRHLSAKGHFSQACAVFSNTLKFFMTNYKDTTDYLISSYKFGSFTKIYEFVKFRERLNNSLQYAAITVERMILDLVLETSNHSDVEQILYFMDVDPEKDKTAWNNLRDNRDFSVMINWDYSDSQKLEEACQSSFADEVEWLKLRNLIIRSLSAAYLLSQNADHDEKISNNDVRNGEKRSVANIVLELLDQLKSYSGVLNTICQRQEHTYSIQGPEFSRLNYYHKGCYLDVLIEFLELVLYLNSLVEKGLSDKEENAHEDAMKGNIVNLFQESINRQSEKIVPDIFSLQDWEEMLETLTNFAETLGFAAILCGVCQRILKPIRNALTKRKKKRKENIPTCLPQTLTNFNQLIGGMGTVAISLQNCIHSMKAVQIEIAVSNLTLNDQMMPSQETDILSQVQCKVEKSYEQSLKELEELTRHKITYFASLQL